MLVVFYIRRSRYRGILRIRSRYWGIFTYVGYGIGVIGVCTYVKGLVFKLGGALLYVVI